MYAFLFLKLSLDTEMRTSVSSESLKRAFSGPVGALNLSTSGADGHFNLIKTKRSRTEVLFLDLLLSRVIFWG